MAFPRPAIAVAAAAILAACGNAPADLAAINILEERQALENAHPGAAGFAFLDPVNSGLVFNLDGTGTYIRNRGTSPETGEHRGFEYVPVGVTQITETSLCMTLGCLFLSRTGDGDLFCEVHWNEGNVWPNFPCRSIPLPPGFDVTQFRHPDA